ncbi:hypothetical protein [Paracidovorax avenae]|uniref:hypothetical protein n=1 Tax=Paracidovorax avenae TaxID=80867 RepID=UPI001AD83673|nr:hypothetical protein [Paracidovorax avenae]
MKQSPVQLLENTLLKSIVVPLPKSMIDSAADLNLQHATSFRSFPDFWSDEEQSEAVRANTFLVRLALRTAPKIVQPAPYSFELIYSGIVLVLPSSTNKVEEYALQYGLSLLAGSIRETLLGITARMNHGEYVLPTLSFMDESPEEVKTNPQIEGALSPPREEK